MHTRRLHLHHAPGSCPAHVHFALQVTARTALRVFPRSSSMAATQLSRRAVLAARAVMPALRPVASAVYSPSVFIGPNSARAISTSVPAHSDAAASEAPADGRQADSTNVLDHPPSGDAGGIAEALSALDPNVQVVSADGSTAYSPHVVAIGDQVLALNMVDAAELMGYLKEKLGVTDDQLIMPMGGVAVAGPGAGAGAAEEEAPAVEEKTHFELKLAAFDAKTKIKIIKEVRSLTGLGLKEAKELVESAPAVIMKDVKKEEAESIAAKLKELGAEIELE
ncbi:rplL [Symbiodinium sp. KB8]|nr:rplL [Symbiodinium sp. KB8]